MHKKKQCDLALVASVSNGGIIIITFSMYHMLLTSVFIFCKCVLPSMLRLPSGLLCCLVRAHGACLTLKVFRDCLSNRTSKHYVYNSR